MLLLNLKLEYSIEISLAALKEILSPQNTLVPLNGGGGGFMVAYGPKWLHHFEAKIGKLI